MQSTRYSCQISTVLNFLNRLLKNPQTSNLKKIHPVGTELFHEDGKTDVIKVIVAFRYFANAPKDYI